MKKERVDVLVIGGGPAGSIAASIIHKAGFSVKVIEKENFPRFVIGESLIPHCMEGFEAAGFIDAINTGGFQKKFGAKFVRGSEMCDFNFSDQFTPGWNWTWQVKRSSFDQTLTDELIARGVEVSFQTQVTNADFSKEKATVYTRDAKGIESCIDAGYVIDASGYGRVLPRLLNLEKSSSLDPRKAIFTHITDTHREQFYEPDRIIILSIRPGIWSWTIPFSDGTSSLGIVGENILVDGEQEEALIKFIREDDYLSRRFSDQTFLFPARKLEAWSVATERVFGNRFVMVGNATEFLDPIFSSGVMFASISSHLAARLVIRELKGESVAWQEEYADYLRAGISVFRSYVNAWYDGTLEKIFYAANPNPEVQKKICSVLAGYVWDQDNPYVKDHATILKRLVKMIHFRDTQALQ